MIFSTSNYWTADAMQWALNAERLDEGYQSMAKRHVAEEDAAANGDAKTLFANRQIANTLQGQLNGDLARVEVR